VELGGNACHNQRRSAQNRPRDRPHRQNAFPHHRSVVAVVAAKNVVERNEVHALVVEHREAEHVGARAPFPVRVGVARVDRMQLIIKAADKDSIADRQDADRRFAQLVRPDVLAGQERERNNASVCEREVHAIPGRCRRCVQRGAEIALPEHAAISSSDREQRPRTRGRKQPTGVPMQ
jgi:hypothetical protein